MGKSSRAKKSQRAARQGLASDTRTFWHGGAAGLEVGEMLVPGVKVPGYAEILRAADQSLVAEIAPTWVYITTDRDLAFDYAALQGSLFGAGALMRVKPLEPMVVDPDYRHVDGLSYRTKRAQILEVEEVVDGSLPASPTGAALRYKTWDDGTRMYTDEGLALPNLTQVELGVSASDLEPLGRAPEYPAINALAGKLVVRRHPGITQAEIDAVRKRHGGSVGVSALERRMRASI